MKKMLVAAPLVLLVPYLAPIATMLGKQTALDLTGECYRDSWEKAGHWDVPLMASERDTGR